MTEWMISSSVLIAVVAAVRYLLKGKIALGLQYGLWLLVLVRLLVPVSFGESRVSVMNAVPGGIPSVNIPSTGGPAQNTTSGQAVPANPDTALNPDIVETVTAFPDSPTNPSVRTVDWSDVVGDLWLGGVGAVGLCLIVSNVHFGRKLKKTRQRVAVAGYPMPVYRSDTVETPCMFGLFRPVVYVTTGLMENERGLRHVLAHEATHYRHRDYIWSALRGICLALHWYNPLVWWAAVLSRRDGELACDEGTIRRLGESERMDYGRTLIGLTCAKRGAGALLLNATTMTGGKKSIQERIALIARKPRMAIYTLIGVLLVATIAVGATFTGMKDRNKRTEIFTNGTVTITVAEKYADLLYMDSADMDIDTDVIANIYYQPDYTPPDVRGAEYCGGWMMSVIAYPNDLTLDMTDRDAMGGITHHVGAVDGDQICFEKYANAGERHYSEHPENTEIYEEILASLQVDYGDLPPYAPPTEEEVVEELILSYLRDTSVRPNWRYYFADDQPEVPEEEDYRIDSISYAGETVTYEALGVAYEVHYSRYLDTGASQGAEKVYGWREGDPYYIVLRHSGYDDNWVGVYGTTDRLNTKHSVEETILEVVYGLQDIEVSINIDGYPSFIGPWSSPPSIHNEERTTTVLEGWEPIHVEGNYWMQIDYPNLTAICLNHTEENRASIHSLETTRADVETYRGIPIGATRDEVIAAYPEIRDTTYWGYEGDYLWYCDNDGGWGASLIFWIEHDRVVKFELIDMFD